MTSLKQWLGLIFVVAFCLPVFSAEEKKTGTGCIKRIQGELNLSAEQKTKLDELKDKTKFGTKEKRKAMEQCMQELESLISGSASEKEVRAKFSELQTLEDAYAKARLEKILAVREILTPEQSKKFKNCFDNR